MKRNPGLIVVVVIVVIIIVAFYVFYKQKDEFNNESVTCEFDARRYADAYPDLKNAFGYDENQLINHYKQYGRHEGRSPCGDPNRQKIAEMARQKIAKMARHKMGRRG